MVSSAGTTAGARPGRAKTTKRRNGEHSKALVGALAVSGIDNFNLACYSKNLPYKCTVALLKCLSLIPLPWYTNISIHVCIQGRWGMGYYRFYQVFPVGPVWPHWRPRVGSLPIIAGLRCRPGVHPSIAPRPVRYALRPEPGSLPQDHPGSGVVAPWLPPGQLHGNSSTSLSSPCRPMCCVCIGVFTAGGARGSEAASVAYSVWRFPQKGCP